jgi:enoyl-CoA hydratase/carnithine racemase
MPGPDCKPIAAGQGCPPVCDFRIASADAFVQESWIRIGLLPPLGRRHLLPRLIGLSRAAEMVPRENREPQGGPRLVSSVKSSSGTCSSSAERSLRRNAPPLDYAAAKGDLHRGMETSMEAEWSANLPSQALQLGSEDFREDLAAVAVARPALKAGESVVTVRPPRVRAIRVGPRVRAEVHWPFKRYYTEQ